MSRRAERKRLRKRRARRRKAERDYLERVALDWGVVTLPGKFTRDLRRRMKERVSGVPC